MGYNSLSELFTATANAIRSKTGGTKPIVANEFPDAIKGLFAPSMYYYNNRVVTISGHAFYSLDAFRNVFFADAKTVENYAFRECVNLTTAYFDQKVSFAVGVFLNCSSLIALVLRNAEISTCYTGIFDGTPVAEGTGYVYVPRSLVDSYKTANKWSAYASQFRALEDYTVDGTTTGELDMSKI